MSWTPTDEQVEKGAAAMYPRAFSRDAQWISDESRDRALNEMRRQARAVLVAVGPMIAAQGVREYVAAARENGWIGTWDAFDALNDAEQWADQIEKEAGR